MDDEIVSLINAGHYRVSKLMGKTIQVFSIPDVIVREIKHDMVEGIDNKIIENVCSDDLEWNGDVLELDCFVFTRKQLETLLVLARLSGVKSHGNE